MHFDMIFTVLSMICQKTKPTECAKILVKSLPDRRVHTSVLSDKTYLIQGVSIMLYIGKISYCHT